MKKGKYIVIEGGEGCGKSTQAKLLVDYLNLREIPSQYFREPGGTDISEQIRTILLSNSNLRMHSLTELFLFEAGRVEVFDKIVIPGLDQGRNMISDRSFYSTLAYQAYGRGLDADLINLLNKQATFEIKPDLVVFVDIPSDKGLEKQVEKDRIGAEENDFHSRVNFGYREIAQLNPEIVMIQYRDGDPGSMHKEIIELAEKLF